MRGLGVNEPVQAWKCPNCARFALGCRCVCGHVVLPVDSPEDRAEPDEPTDLEVDPQAPDLGGSD